MFLTIVAIGVVCQLGKELFKEINGVGQKGKKK